MTDRPHADPPKICGQCLEHLYANLGDESKVFFLFCDHQGPGSLLRATTSSGRIVHWILDGPCTLDAVEGELARQHEISSKFLEREQAAAKERGEKPN